MAARAALRRSRNASLLALTLALCVVAVAPAALSWCTAGSFQRALVARAGPTALRRAQSDFMEVGNAIGDGGTTPLMLAAYRNDAAEVKRYGEVGDDVNIRDSHGWTALHYAERKNNREAVEVIRTPRGVLKAGDTPFSAPLSPPRPPRRPFIESSGAIRAMVAASSCSTSRWTERSPAGEATPDAAALATPPTAARRRLYFKQPEPRPTQAELPAKRKSNCSDVAQKRLKTKDLRVLPTIMCKDEPGEEVLFAPRRQLEVHLLGAVHLLAERIREVVETLSEVRDAVHELRRAAVPGSQATPALTAEAE
eukprot:CAMPEP_0175529192 /NCGR_PEP_ID=MMETSP0096-20121207/21027_1 /TAXON_ID=311494 /ORGANISM="Alexandrium monilatum, Strain CCMP3105" /LENGTH=309 /DNA_ID=CAMNT_0016831891 /DNA_START=69 /DNA_END=998 /DNA_ORIENTATION=+